MPIELLDLVRENLRCGFAIKSLPDSQKVLLPMLNSAVGDKVSNFAKYWLWVASPTSPKSRRTIAGKSIPWSSKL
jgi:hypothetical protein